MNNFEKTAPEEIVHYGVKGMKWGVRKAEPTNSEYSKQMQRSDRQQHGKRAVRRINRRMNKGESRKKALEREDVRNRRQALIAVGGVYAARVLVMIGPDIVNLGKAGIVNKANINRTRAANADRFGLPSTATKTPYSKARRGVYNITTMK